MHNYSHSHTHTRTRMCVYVWIHTFEELSIKTCICRLFRLFRARVVQEPLNLEQYILGKDWSTQQFRMSPSRAFWTSLILDPLGRGHQLSEAGRSKLNGGSSKLSAYFGGMEQPMLIGELAQLKSRFLDTMADIFLFLFQQVSPSLFINLSLAKASCWGWLYCPVGGNGLMQIVLALWNHCLLNKTFVILGRCGTEGHQKSMSTTHRSIADDPPGYISLFSMKSS